MSEIPDPEAPAEHPPSTDGREEPLPAPPTVPPFPLAADAPVPPAVPPFPPASDASFAPGAAEGSPVEAQPALAEAPPPAVEPVVAPRRRRWRWLRPALRARDLAVFIRGALLLAITGASLAMLGLQLAGKLRGRVVWELPEFVSQNQVPARARMQMLAWLAGGGAAGALIALVTYFWRARRSSAAARAVRVLRAGRLLWPLMVPSLAWSVVAGTGMDPLSRVSGIIVVAALTEVSVRRALGEVLSGRLALARLVGRVGAAASRAFARIPRRVAPETVVVLLAAVFYAVWMSRGTLLQHREFGTSAFDLGNYDTMFFNALHGRPFRCLSVFPKGPSGSMLSLHAELTMFALLPFYALRPGAETLLVLQTVVLASGVFPLYRFAARRLPRPAALVLALAYLLYAPMHQANFYDFHFLPLAVAFALWAIDMLDARRLVAFTIFFLLALGCREDVAIAFVALGLYHLLSGRHVRAGGVLIVVSLAYFVFVKLVVMRHFEGPWSAELNIDPTGVSTYGGAAKTLLANPAFAWKRFATLENIVFFLVVLAPVAFLPLRRKLLWLGFIPAVPLMVMMTGYSRTSETSFLYVMVYVPFMFLASALALAGLRDGPRGRTRLAGAVCGVAMATFLASRVWGAMPTGDQCGRGFRSIPDRRGTVALEVQKAHDIAALTAKIPPDAAVAATEMEHPHVSTRLNALALRNGYEGADYILYSEDGAGAEAARQALASGTYESVESRPATRLALLRKKQR